MQANRKSDGSLEIKVTQAEQKWLKRLSLVARDISVLADGDLQEAAAEAHSGMSALVPLLETSDDEGGDEEDG
ncbi:MAG TPA: hypothetical protein DCE55_29300 [Planctomycetaceae bacterium]|nr:hypothetical protein [Planctomycetaceae bacterium]|tara:strand:- start:12024 stop:12242 length:219 start_codon:yes stop_codon:yes gene_type:complete